jgi:hypothetical protein
VKHFAMAVGQTAQLIGADQSVGSERLKLSESRWNWWRRHRRTSRSAAADSRCTTTRDDLAEAAEPH